MKVIVYTNYLVAEYDVNFPGTKEDLAKALDEGSVLLDVYDKEHKCNEGTVLINPFNAVLIEIKDTPLS